MSKTWMRPAADDEENGMPNPVLDREVRVDRRRRPGMIIATQPPGVRLHEPRQTTIVSSFGEHPKREASYVEGTVLNMRGDVLVR